MLYFAMFMFGGLVGVGVMSMLFVAKRADEIALEHYKPEGTE